MNSLSSDSNGPTDLKQAPPPRRFAQEFADEFVPMRLWSKDHWSTLAYLETVMVECAGFEVGADPRMKSNRRHVRVMSKERPRPKRPAGLTRIDVQPMLEEHATALSDGRLVPNHDDWMCVQDFGQAGLLTTNADGIEPGEVLHLSPRGLEVVRALRQHKAAGGSFSDFNAVAFFDVPSIEST